MKKLFILLTLLLVTSDAWAAARYWVGGTGNWDAADTTHWAATSGGAGGQSVPGSSDDVTFDGSSGGGTVTVTATQNILSLTMSAFTGTLDTNDQTMTIGSFTSTGSATRTLDLGASAINITGTGTPWNMSGATNMTLTAGTSIITVSGSSANFNSGGSGFTYYEIIMNGASTQVLASGTGLNCTNFTRTGTATKTNGLQTSGNLTVSGTLTINGNSPTNRVLILSNTLGTARTITAATVSISNADFRDITGAGAASWDLSAITGLSGDCGGNSGITFTTASDQHWISTTGGNWSDVAKWTSRVPLPQDSVYFDNAFNASQTVTSDMPRFGKNIDWTGVSGTPSWSITASTPTMYGSITLTSGVNVGASLGMTFEGRGVHTITSNGKSFGSAVNINAFGGTYSLSDAYSNTGAILTLNNGTFNDSGFSISSLGFSSSNSNTRAVTASGTWNLQGSGSRFTMTTTTGLAWSHTGTINMNNSSSGTFAGGGLTYNIVDFRTAGIVNTITGANTFGRLMADNGATSITLPGSTTTTIISGDGLGNGTNVITFTASSGSATVAKSGGGTVGWDYVSLTNIPASTANTWYAGTHSTDGGGNTNWSFTDAPPSGSLLNYAFPYQRRSDIR